MKYKLFKMSEPGWTLEFDTRKEVEYKLLRHICSECKEEMLDEIMQGGDPMYEALGTPCGLEFDVEEVSE